VKITIFGYFGKGNIGDEVMLSSALKFYSQVDDIDVIDVFRTDDLESRESKVKFVNICGLVGKLKLLKSIFTSSKLLWIGGTCLYDSEGLSGLVFIKKIMRLCSFLKVEVHFVSVGVGNIITSEGKELVNYIINKCTSISLREKNSYNYVIDNCSELKKVSSAGDLFFLSSELVKDSRCKSITKSYITFTGHYDYSVNQQVVSKCVDLVNGLINKYNVDVYFIPFHQGNSSDNEFHAKVIEGVVFKDKVKIYNDIKVDEVAALICDAMFHVGFRLHSVVLSELACTPYVALSYSPKVERFVSKFHPMSSSQAVIELCAVDYLADFDAIIESFSSNVELIKLEKDLALASLKNVIDEK
jgi:polysaccharide pyruvyl transferase WcaK-like protein